MCALHRTKTERGVPWLEGHITLHQLRVLSLLAAHERGLSGRELAASLGVRPSAITPLIDRLEEQGYVQREEDREDRRITRQLITEAGLTLLERMIAGRRELMTDVLGRLQPSELEVVDRAFGILCDGIQRLAAEPTTGRPIGQTNATTLSDSDPRPASRVSPGI
ncbi:MAG: MarR family transcriptional regulator [Chloroflexi bacterium]|nr:MarR family transcriptional regulator [Chloroflexota bacterium]